MATDPLVLSLLPPHIARRIRVSRAGCWLWTGGKVQGYGLASIDGKMYRLHRWVYQRVHGELPEWLDLDHLCRRPPCCNPAHLEPVSHRENLLRSPLTRASINRAKTACKAGHPFDEENTYWYEDRGRMRRMCRECGRWAGRRSMRRAAEKREKAA